MCISRVSHYLLLLSGIIFSNISVATELKNPVLPISDKDVFSIVVTPNKSQRANSYRLKIYTSAEQKTPAVDILHPLNGQISDVEIYDVDNDNDQELVVQSTRVVGIAKIHRDIFELGGKSLLDKVKAFFHF